MARENATQHHKNYWLACVEVKELKEKLKGNMSLIQAREIIWNDIIQQVKAIWDHMIFKEKDK